MDDWILAVIAFLLVVFQVVACIFAKKAWLRLLPFLVSVALVAFCLTAYFLSNMTNWGYVILVGLLGIVLSIQGITLLISRFIRRKTK